jgi:hypothetical protein
MTKYNAIIVAALVLFTGCVTMAERRAEIEATLRAQLEAERALLKAQAVEQRKTASHERFEDFAKKNHIVDWPEPEEFQANPFVYENYNIGIVATFHSMITPTQGIFGSDIAQMLLVSDIPKGLFVKKSKVVLVGSVVGKEQAKVPSAGEALVPHLKFVDAHICKTDACDALFFWKKHRDTPQLLATTEQPPKEKQ